MLKLQNISVATGDKTITADISLHVKPGEIHLLLGKNGSGKSSLCMGIAGNPNYTITNGDMFIQGKKATNLTPEQKAIEGLFLSFQNPPEIEGLTVVQLVKTATNILLKKRGEKELSAPEFFQKLQELQSEIGIEQSLLTRSLNKDFSGGEKKKIEMLQMKFFNPTIAILDEPDSGVDVNTKRIISKTIQDMREKEKTAFLVVTHTFDFAKTLNPDIVHVIQDGKLIATGDKTLLNRIEKTGF
ncbi:MAG: Fe-S cluster assembly ATPase SufC [Alphaproteobacteria bacterium]|nr:Fe-S cluster assembly ATPase SufC [Alphaproteobacteria bacterium]MBN2780156.1 Fe-S cluster assembly ATPase SufC [Alphaproteobacteria bacterium]